MGALYEIGHGICRVHRNSWIIRMSGRGILEWRWMVYLAGFSGASRNRLGYSPSDETPIAATLVELTELSPMHDELTAVLATSSEAT
jgi:hypothetical protein